MKNYLIRVINTQLTNKGICCLGISTINRKHISTTFSPSTPELNQPKVNCVSTERRLWPTFEIFKRLLFSAPIYLCETKNIKTWFWKPINSTTLYLFDFVVVRIRRRSKYKLTQPIKYLSTVFNFLPLRLQIKWFVCSQFSV